MKKLMASWMLCVSLLATVVQGAVSVRNVTVQQRWPWNGLVDIDYEVLTDSPEEKVSIHANGHDSQTGQSVLMATLTGDGVGQRVGAGHYRMTWDSTTDAPALNTTAFSVSLQAVSGTPLYMVVDLSAGYSLAYPAYPVTYLDREPEGGWTDEYKTTKMALRLIKPGVFVMGSPTDELGREAACESQHQVTITQPFYIGIFEVTQKQWELVMSTTPATYKGDMRPVEHVSYNDIRGATLGAQWPASNSVDPNSFMGRLRARSPMVFDLPTEAQWEYACRAGTSTALNSGKNLTAAGQCPNMAEVGRYNLNQSDGKGGYTEWSTTVGSYLPNVWGLYDMHGNVCEWCLDWFEPDLGDTPVIDPKGAETGSSRALRGSHYYGYYIYMGSAQHFRSAHRATRNSYGDIVVPVPNEKGYGFRVIAHPAAP